MFPFKRAILVGVVTLLLAFGFPQLAYARGGCFAAGTGILTPNGYKPVEQIRAGDRVLGYNFVTHQKQIETVGAVQTLLAPDFYWAPRKIGTRN
jgi:hypothetical protein